MYAIAVHILCLEKGEHYCSIWPKLKNYPVEIGESITTVTYLNRE